ncbi:MAG: hypothetical protein M3R15_05580 [Acidobacteriota bacterium]|nr:hypothetical protein [Acidobacteriota bacterium]
MLLPPSSESRQSIKLILSDVMRNLRVEITEPRASAGEARLEQQSSGEAVTWTVYPARPIAAGEAVRLRFSYDGGEQTRFVFYIGAEGSFAGGNSTAWYPQIERDARATGTLRFSVPAGYTVFAPGAEISGISSAPQQSAGARFDFTITRPSYFSFAAGRYSVERRRSFNGTPTSAYLLRPRPRIGDFLDNCARVLDALTQEFGANPYGEFALVEVPTEQAGRARFDGASGEGFIFSNGNFLDADFNVAYYGHEIAHQWWGVAIGRKWWESSRGRLMLDEAMAQYGSLRAVETIEGTRVAERYRRTGYPGYIDFHNADGYFMVEAGGFDHKLSDLPDGEVSRIIADSKGFLVFDMLARTIGRENYRRILRGIARRYAFGNLSWDEFLRLIETGAGRDLQWFYAQWFERAGAPEWNLEWRQEGNTVRGIITQSLPFYRAAVEVSVEGDDSRNFVRSVELRDERTEFTLPVNFRARAATVDPRFLVLHRTPEYRALRSAMGAYLRSNIEREQGKFDAAEKLLRDALAQETTPDLYGARFTLELGLGQLLLSQNKFADAREHLEAAIASPSRRANVLPWAYFYLARVAKELNDVILLRRAVDGAITADDNVGGRTGVSRQARALR